MATKLAHHVIVGIVRQRARIWIQMMLGAQMPTKDQIVEGDHGTMLHTCASSLAHHRVVGAIHSGEVDRLCACTSSSYRFGSSLYLGSHGIAVSVFRLPQACGVHDDSAFPYEEWAGPRRFPAGTQYGARLLEARVLVRKIDWVHVQSGRRTILNHSHCARSSRSLLRCLGALGFRHFRLYLQGPLRELPRVYSGEHNHGALVSVVAAVAAILVGEHERLLVPGQVPVEIRCVPEKPAAEQPLVPMRKRRQLTIVHK